MKDTKIQWCDDTVNFITGCTKVSEGCANCYAEAQASRFPTFGKWGPNGTRKLHESAFKLAHRLNRTPFVTDCCGCGASPYDEVCHRCGKVIPLNGVHRRRIFSLSMGDWLDPMIPVEWLARMLDTIRLCKAVNWLLLTKRPELWLERMTLAIGSDLLREAHGKEFNDWMSAWTRGNAPSHVWLGASVENQKRAEERVPALLRIPAALHFLSCEPLLGPLDPTRLYWPDMHGGDKWENCLEEGVTQEAKMRYGIDISRIKWVIVGGESGTKARPCDTGWIMSLIAQCNGYGVPCFVKQLGAKPAWGTLPRPEPRDRKGGDPAEWPTHLQVREFPK